MEISNGSLFLIINYCLNCFYKGNNFCGDIMFNKSNKDTSNKLQTNNKGNSLEKKLENNILLFKSIFNNDETLITREFENKWLSAAHCCIIYLDGMVNTEIINENIIQPVLRADLSERIDSHNLLEELGNKIIVSNDVKVEGNLDKIIEALLYGDTLLLVNGYNQVLIISSKGWQTRAVTEPESAKIVRGPREGFNESIIVNLSLLRRKIQNTDLKMKFRKLGTQTHTKVCVCYIEGLALNEIIIELESRLDKIDIDGIIDSGYIQELIRDAPFSPFETVGHSERPDVIAAKLLEGRVALFVDGSPFVLTVPYVIAENTQANEDYYNNYIFSSFNRFIRVTGTILSVCIPALYLAIVTFHQEMLPTPLLLSISASRQGVPIPTSLSMIVMLLIFDILREAGTRMPVPIGQAVNIVGTLVLGQAAVEAKLVSAPVIIVTALSGILTLLNINLIGASVVVKYMLLIASSVLGVYGFIFGLILVIVHLLSIRSFGVPYTLNLASVKNHNGQDIWIRAPWWEMTLRPKIIAARNLVRQSTKKGRR